MLEPQTNLDWKWPLEVIWSVLCSKQRTNFEVRSNLEVRSGFSADSTTSMGNLFQCLTTLPVKACFLRFNQNFCCCHLGPSPLTFSLCTRGNCPCHVTLAEDPPLRLPSYRLNKQGSITSSHVMGSSLLITLVALQWVHSGMSMSLFYWEALNWT